MVVDKVVIFVCPLIFCCATVQLARLYNLHYSHRHDAVWEITVVFFFSFFLHSTSFVIGGGDRGRIPKEVHFKKNADLRAGTKCATSRG